MRIGNRLVRGRELLRFIADIGGELAPVSHKEAFRRFYNPGRRRYFNLEDYFPSELRRMADGLARRGWVRKEQTSEGMRIILTDGGREEILLFKLDEFEPKKGEWDGKWRMVFFDVSEDDRLKRNKLRKCLLRLGMYKMQQSVWICPYDCDQEVKYIREVLNIPHGVKLGVLEKIENDEELKEIFDL